MALTASNSLLTGTSKPAGTSLKDGLLLHKCAERLHHKVCERHLEVEEIYEHTISQTGNAAASADLQEGKCGGKKKVLQHTFSLWSSHCACREPSRALAPHQKV